MNLRAFVATALSAAAPLALICPQPSMATSIATAPQSTEDIKAQADAILSAAYPANGPGAAAIVMRGGKLIYAGGRGLADLEARRLVTPDTPFKIGSIGKQFTAAIILQLVAEGKVSLDDPVSRFFPDWPQPTAHATLRQLLNHTSGIQDLSKIPGWIDKYVATAPDTADLLKEMRSAPAKSDPGQKWEYNNTAYMLLPAIIEQVTGKEFDSVLSERLVQPLGLRTIRFSGSSGPQLAQGYTEREGNYYPAKSAEMLAASVTDFAKWTHALHHGKLVPPALYKEMTVPARLADGTTRPYGFAFRLHEFLDKPVLVHGGAGNGIDADSVYVPSEDLFVAVFANSDELEVDASTVSRRLVALAMGKPFPTFTPVKVARAAVEPLFGAYAADGGPSFNFFAGDGKFYLSRGERRMEAIPAGGDRFYFGPDTLTWAKFIRDANGKHVLEMHEIDELQPLRAVRAGDAAKPFAVPAAVLKTYAGTYKTEIVTVKIAMNGKGQLTIFGPGASEPFVMRPVSATEFVVDDGGYRVAFHPEDGIVKRLTMRRGARELHGVRQP